MRTPSLFSNVRQRTDQIDAFTRRYELPDHCVGGDAGYSLAQDPGRLTTARGLLSAHEQPAEEGGSEGDGFCAPGGTHARRAVSSVTPAFLPEGAPWRTQERGQLRQDEAPRRWVEVCFENHADQETFQETFEKRNAAYTGIRSDQM